jgi:hypothetical protein
LPGYENSWGKKKTTRTDYYYELVEKLAKRRDGVIGYLSPVNGSDKEQEWYSKCNS